jgi:predicted amidophosphoribosyltransferase
MLISTMNLLLPVRCGGCDVPGPPLCADCASVFDGPYGVRRPVTSTGPPIYALAGYRTRARDVVLAFKERGRRDLAGPLGRMVAAVVPLLAGPAVDGTWWLVPAPSRSIAARRRGGSHTLRLARKAAAALDTPACVAPALRLARGARDSVGLDVSARAANLAGRVLVRPAGLPPAGTPVVLLDDVVTTGETAAACVHELQTAGGLTVSAVLALTAA